MSNISSLTSTSSSSALSSSTQRITGLVSGLDVDSLVKQMLASQQAKLDKANQQRALIDWQKEAYSSVVSTLNTFQSTYLDILSPNSILKPSNFTSMTTSVPAAAANYFTASAVSGSPASSLTVNSISQLATAQKIETADKQINDETIKLLAGKSMNVTVNGVTKQITVASDITDADAIISDINSQLISSFGKQSDGTPKVAFTMSDPDNSGNRTISLNTQKNAV
ncbi:MAG: hypothetical protein FWD71_10435, partial [Oscillospiraceae bacterium]|nr:hypothetical protein [Oscillospiraceae bacterium]